MMLFRATASVLMLTMAFSGIWISQPPVAEDSQEVPDCCSDGMCPAHKALAQNEDCICSMSSAPAPVALTNMGIPPAIAPVVMTVPMSLIEEAGAFAAIAIPYDALRDLSTPPPKA